MYKIFLIFFALECIKADDDDSNEKYIDLLPEEEKQEFLNRIARRILEDVNSRDQKVDDPNASHTEINEDQLNAQNAYVSEIIKEETKNLHGDKIDDKVEKEQGEANQGNERNDNERYIDLTLRTNGRNDSEILEHIEAASELKVIPVKTINDQENIEPDDNQTNINNNSIAGDINFTTEFVTEIALKDLLTPNALINAENLKNRRKSYDEKSLLRTTMSHYDPNSEENTSATDDDVVTDVTSKPDSIEMVTTTETDDEIVWISTQKIYDTDNESKENRSSESEEKVPSGALTTTSSSTNSTVESETDEPEITTLKPEDSNTTNGQSELYVRAGYSDMKGSTNIKEVGQSNLSTLNLKEETVNSNNYTVDDTTLGSGNASDVSKIHSNESEQNKTDVTSDDSQTSLLQSSLSKELKKDDLSIQNTDSKKTAKEYEVFEVVADKPSFVKESVEKNDENEIPKYFVPVYNYDSDNAYFNPRSRFGSNAEPDAKNEKVNKTRQDEKQNETRYLDGSEEDSRLFISPVSRSLFSGYNKRDPVHFKSKSHDYLMKTQNKNVFKISRPNMKNQFPNNPNDYLDMDYYLGRSNFDQSGSGETDYEQVFPGSDEEDHPFHSIHKMDSMQNHIRAIRKIMFLNQMYEYKPDIYKKAARNSKDKRKKGKGAGGVDTRETYMKPDVNNIAVDYYFGVPQNLNTMDGARSSKKYKSTNNNVDSKINEDIGPMLEVLKDFIRFNNQALLKYNWLETTVDILSAIEKLLDLTKQLQFGQHIDRRDLELLKYALYLYKSSINALTQQNVSNEDHDSVKLQRKKGLLPKNKWKKRISEPLKLWKDVAKFIRKKEQKQDGKVKLIYDFEEFLQKVLFYLNDFHDAIKHIAIITKYNNQKWFEDIKNIYLKEASDKRLLKLLLHLALSRLFNFIEESSIYGAEDNYRDYIKNNKKYVNTSKDGFILVFNIMNELKQLRYNR